MFQEKKLHKTEKKKYFNLFNEKDTTKYLIDISLGIKNALFN